MKKSVLLIWITGTGDRFPYWIGMLTATEYQLKAQNYAAAAQTVEDEEVRLELMRLSAACRNKALQLKLGQHANVLREDPYFRDEPQAY